MTPEFKQELQNLIDGAAEKHTNGFDTTDFKAGCDFLIPLIEASLKQTAFYIKGYHKAIFGTSDSENIEEEHIAESQEILLNQFRGEK